jgi:hypothetical protein
MGTIMAVIGSWLGLSVIFVLLVGRAMAVARRVDPPELPLFAAAARGPVSAHAAFARPRRARLRA